MLVGGQGWAGTPPMCSAQREMIVLICVRVLARPAWGMGKLETEEI